jgi:hypothetical protein
VWKEGSESAAGYSPLAGYINISNSITTQNSAKISAAPIQYIFGSFFLLYVVGEKYSE